MSRIVFPTTPEEKRFVAFFSEDLPGFGISEAMVYGAILHYYPATRKASLPKVLLHTLKGKSEKEVEDALTKIIDIGLLEVDPKNPKDEIKEPYRYSVEGLMKLI